MSMNISIHDSFFSRLSRTDNFGSLLAQVHAYALYKTFYTPLIFTAYTGNVEEAKSLIAEGQDVNKPSRYGITPLHLAAYKEHTGVIAVLLKKAGLNLNPQDERGDTPLHLAAPRAIRQLLNAGADPNLKNKEGKAAISESLLKGRSTVQATKFFVKKGAFLENCDYEFITQKLFLIDNLLKDVEFCTRSVVNRFHHQSLPALKGLPHFTRMLPSVDSFKLKDEDVKDVENWVKSEIERHSFCNIVKVHPLSLSALCVRTLITCQSGKKRAASPDFGHSSSKKNRNETA